jgi:hypothetical protein
MLYLPWSLYICHGRFILAKSFYIGHGHVIFAVVTLYLPWSFYIRQIPLYFAMVVLY